jgi:hypothetical protein
MALPSLLERILGTVFGSDQGGADDPAVQALARDLTELIVEARTPAGGDHERARTRNIPAWNT